MPDHITTPGDDPRFAVAAPGLDFKNRRSDQVEWERHEEAMAFLAGEGIPTRWDPDPKAKLVADLRSAGVGPAAAFDYYDLPRPGFDEWGQRKAE